MVIAKTQDGDIGVLTGHSPVLGILVEGLGNQARHLVEGSARATRSGKQVGLGC